MQIQLDMYAVELGAALLLQFETPTGVVRILADAGEARYDVKSRLKASMAPFGGKLHIDLMIGTHYDADHLDGLVAIIENDDITIGEAWIPPVANDTEVVPFGGALRDSSLLALQFARDDGREVLRRYLSIKADECARLAQLEYQADERRDIGPRLARERQLEVLGRLRSFNTQREAAALSRAYFEAELQDAARTIADPAGDASSANHADIDSVDPWQNDDIANQLGRAVDWWWDGPGGIRREALSPNPDLAALEARTVAMIRQATAKDAITAASLAAVVEALKNKGVNIRSSTIADGQPRSFGWVRSTGRFEPALAADPDSPTLTLLGPSEGLVNKFRHILPTGNYLLAARMVTIPIKPITPSNQLSYILVVEHQGQRILVSGDAGSVDFKPPRSREFYEPLIAELSPLHIVQVAHHGGNNAYFYRCLLASGFKDQEPVSYLLLSHATLDRHRPSEVFSKFVEELGRAPVETQLLFTSKPQEPKVRDITAFIGQAVGTSQTSGDVRLNYDGAAWSVTAHHVTIP